MKQITWIAVALMSPLAFADGHKELAWDAVLTGEHRSEGNKARDAARRPQETLTFFGLTPEYWHRK